MSLGPLMVDVAGMELTNADRELLTHPLVGGVILFTRNYADPDQVAALVHNIHSLRVPPLLVAVDQEGGRVQRFRENFTLLPPARLFGRLHDQDANMSCRLAETCGWLMAAELRAVGVDVSFSPVLDLDYRVSSVIGDRAFHQSAEVVGELGRSWILGMRRAGMAATAKHFPGHGAVRGDSHRILPVDGRSLADIHRHDIRPFERLIRLELAAVMMAHVVYPVVNALPASFSKRWVERELRRRLGFEGVVFCDDLSMRGAAGAGDYVKRALAALDAGCDMLPVCNSRSGVISIIQALVDYRNPVSQWRLSRLHGRQEFTLKELHASREWREARTAIEHHYAGRDFKLEI
jgi:beta-N-acetylhexosaminidase